MPCSSMSSGDDGPPGEEAQPGNPETSDIEAFESVVDESRAILDHQIAFLNQMDDAALRTVRTSVIVIGIVVSAAGLAPDASVGSINVVSFVLGVLGVISLLGSIILGVYTYRRSNATLGPSRDFADEVRNERYGRVEWYDLLLDGFDEWHTEMREELEENAEWLLIVQTALVVGIVFLALSVALILVPL